MHPTRPTPFSLKSDVPAALVVFLVALPLCLGISLASGAPLVSGIIAGIVGGIVVGALSGSDVGVSGPAAGLAVIVLTAIQDLGSFNIFLVAVILAGVIQLALGYLRAGVIGYYFPSAVISGMLGGIGIVIFLKQIPHALGYDKDYEGDLAFSQIDGETTLSEVGAALNVISPGPMIITAVALVILVLWETKWIKGSPRLSMVPGPLLAVVTGMGLSLLFDGMGSLKLKADQLVNIPVIEGMAGLKKTFAFPDFSALRIGAVYKTAVVMAIVASLETLLCVEATDKLDPRKRVTPTNRELKAQGVGNMISGFIGGLPVTQVIVRSSANIQAGAHSKGSAIIHGVFLVIAVFALPTLMNRIPLAVLAAILLVVGYKLARPSLFKRMWKAGPAQFVPFFVTILGVVFVDLLVGIGIGIAFAVVGLLIENFRLPFDLYNSPAEKDEHVRIVLAQQVTFLNKASVQQTLNAIPNESSVEIDGTNSVYVHADVIEIINDFVASAPARDLQVVVKDLEGVQKGHPTGGANVTITMPSQDAKTPAPAST